MTELYEFQKRYINNAPAKYIFAADTGTGKTLMSLAHYAKHGRGLPLLILAPASKVRTGDWQKDVVEQFGEDFEYEIYSYEKFTRIPTITQYRKTGNEGMVKDYLKRHPGSFALIADEVHKAKNPQSNTGRGVFQLGSRAQFFVGLSATPLPNGWLDAANYFKVFGFSKGITDFKNRYIDYYSNTPFPMIRGYWHEGELQKRWASIAKPLSKDEALDLPDLTFVPVRLEAGPEYMKVQKERLFGDRFLDNPSALMHALRRSIIEPKVAWLNDFLEGVSDNVVVFYNYVEEREAMLAMIKKSHKDRKVFRVDGEKHEVPGKADWNTLRRTITLAQYQSGSTGIELTYAATTVYFSPTYSYSNYEQSIGRTNRNGQTHKMTMYLLCAPTTLERDIWGALHQKTNFQVRQWIKSKREELA